MVKIGGIACFSYISLLFRDPDRPNFKVRSFQLIFLEEKAEYKKDMIPYIVGAVLLFGITAIVKVVQQIGESICHLSMMTKSI